MFKKVINTDILKSSYMSRFFPKDNKGHDKTALAFYFGFHFPDGFRAEARDRAWQVCIDYWDLCGKNLKMMTALPNWNWKKIPPDYNMRQWSKDFARGVFKKFQPKSTLPVTQREINRQAIEGSFESKLTEEKWLKDFPETDWAWEMTYHGGRIGAEASDYGVLALGNSTETHGYSYLYLCVPVTWFADHPQHHPLALYLRWSQMLKARYGTAGIGMLCGQSLPINGETSGIARAFGELCPGIHLINPIAYHDAIGGLLSANWLNAVDAELLVQLGGIEGIQKSLAQDPMGHVVGIHPYEGGVVLSAGEYPQLIEGNQLKVPPKAYGPIARLLKPYRTNMPWSTWGIPKDESLDWLGRFDKA